MDKNTFMRELERSLSVLQESELRDILSEYEQHIDMKVKSGLSEEEAIEDFGSLPELTAEILEAYHVRADYGPGQRGGDGRNDGDGSGEGQGNGEKERRAAAETWKARAAGSGKKAAGFLSELGRRALRLARRTGRWFSGVFILEGAAWASLPAVFQTLEAEEGGTAVSDRWKYGDGKCRGEERKRRSIFRKDRRILWTQAGRHGKKVL